jgi:hypothetical protein
MVDRFNFFSRLWLANDDSPASDFVKVERMQRLAALEHHKVRAVDDVVDRIDANGKQ